jgi:hypothetical protein
LLSPHQTSKLNVMCLPSRRTLATNWLERYTLVTQLWSPPS